MKKLLVSSFLLVALGAGCVTSLGGEVRGPWKLAFDLPQGWIMAAPYTDGKYFNTQTITPDLSEVVLQSTDKPALREAELPDGADAATYVTTDFTRIRAMSLYAGTQVPESAEDLGDGFYKVTTCEGDACVDSISPVQYYYVSPDGQKFKFFVIQEGQDLALAESIILSAKLVTESTATETPSDAAIDAQAE